jgi:glycosyltransferase involved in cell wall biosynthesis
LHNEQAVLPHTLRELLATLRGLISEGIISENSYLFFVDDGSQDDTWTLIEKAHADNPKCVRGLKLSRNVGHQNALLAGLLGQIGRADAVISLDANLQDNIAVTKQMIDRFCKDICGCRQPKHELLRRRLWLFWALPIQHCKEIIRP